MYKNNIELNNKLSDYVSLLLEWQTYLNLVSSNSINYIWKRHIKDCLQLKNYICTKNGNVVDLGSGAGLPGLVLAICDTKNHYTLIDSNSKKTTFLNVVKSKLKINNVTIINDRIENQYDKLKADILVARALTNLSQLLIYTNNLLKVDGKAIFLKGEKLHIELKEVSDNLLLNLFSFKIFSNKINNNGKIIIFKKLVRHEQ